MPTLSQLYPTYGTAVRVVNDLEAAGVSANDITLVSGEKGAGARAGAKAAAEARAHAEGLKRGGTLVSVRADDAQANRIATILRASAPADDAGAASQADLAAAETTQQVEVRDETPMDQPKDVAPAGAFQERVFEVRATGEEAIFSKEARVFEEIIIRKRAADRVETVRETLRETKVDIEDSTTPQ